jgi:NAD(P)-dependent dehydrogenase (short-subunit alcohol dehydrogenase family)
MKDHQSLRGQTAIVTGASSGIGYAIASALVRNGVDVFDLDIKGPDTEIPGMHWHKVNITDELEVRDVISRITDKKGTIQILINSAGITGITNVKSDRTDTLDIKKVMEVNFYGSYFTSKYVVPVMVKENYGRILHIASIAGKEGNAGMLAYSASKAAVIAMTKVQGKEFAETGITVNALAPAVIRTPLVEAMPEEQVNYMTAKIPMKRCGSLQEIADMALFIVSPGNSFSTGFTFDLSGGRATY